MKILIVTKSFFPENSPRSHRATQLAVAFKKQGHAVSVVCPKTAPELDLFERQSGIKVIDLGPLKWKPVQLKGAGLALLVRRFVKRILNLLVVYPDLELVWLVSRTMKRMKDVDMLISVAVPYPIHWGVALARERNPSLTPLWIADCGDPFMGQENDTFKYPFYFKYVEKWFCRRTDYLTVPTEGAIAGYYPEFRQKIKVIPQGFDFLEKWPEVQPARRTGVPAFAYAGLFIPGRRDPTEFLNYLKSKQIEFQFHIFTGNDHLVKSVVSGDERFVVHKPIARLELLAQLSEMDFVVNFENIGAKQTPSKLIDYLIIDKPILSIKTGSLNTIIVDEFLAGDYSHRHIVSNAAQYRIENVCAQFLALSAR